MGTMTASTRPMQNPRTAFLVTVGLVFLVGVAAGALAMKVGVHKGLHSAAFWTEPGTDRAASNCPRRFLPLLSGRAGHRQNQHLQNPERRSKTQIRPSAERIPV